jgi:hypothetical protein
LLVCCSANLAIFILVVPHEGCENRGGRFEGLVLGELEVDSEIIKRDCMGFSGVAREFFAWYSIGSDRIDQCHGISFNGRGRPCRNLLYFCDPATSSKTVVLIRKFEN